jgi:hypothetical protein
MWTKEGSVNTGSPRRLARAKPEARKGQAGSPRVAERSVVAMKRVMIAEQRDLSSRAGQDGARARRLAKAYQLQKCSEQRKIVLPADEKLIAQLTSRQKLYDSKGHERF